MELLRLEDISLTRNKKTLLSNINWTVNASEKWIVFGQNGSGKTLLLSIIAGFLYPSSGKIFRFGKGHGTYDIRESWKVIGTLNTRMKRSMSPRENVVEAIISGKFGTLGICDKYTSADKNRACELLEIMNISHLRERTFENLSDGEKERVLIARCLMPSPRILVLDEPCAGLDIAGRESFLTSLDSLAKSMPELGILFVTHHTEEITPMFGNVLMLKNGKVYKKGSVQQLIQDKIISDMLEINIEIEERHGRYWSMVKRK